MTDWTAGYVADIGYTYGYYTELNPLRIKLAFINAGLVPPAIGTACELGFGQGISANMHAAAGNVVWYGTDFNPAQASFAQELAQVSGADAHLYDDAFADFAQRADLPDFDYIGIHGIWSWISDANRTVMVDFIRRKLKVGGVLYISYNTLPGWAGFAPMRHLMTEHAEVLGSPGQGIVSRIDGAIAFADKLMQTQPGCARNNPALPGRLEALKGQNRHYLAHEYFNRDWHPMYFATMAQWLGPAKLQFGCSANPLDAVDAINCSPEQRALLNEIPDPMFRQSVRDYVVNQQFRKDYWVKGARRLAPLDRLVQLRQLRVMLVQPRADIVLKVNGSLGEATLHASVYAPILDALADYVPQSLGQLERALVGKGGAQGEGLSTAQLVEAVFILCGNGAMLPVQDDEVSRQAKVRTDKLNARLMHAATGSNDIAYLVSPVTGGGVNANRFEQLFLLARTLGHHTPQAWVDYVWNLLATQGQKLIKQGQVIDSVEDNIAELTRQANEFAEKSLPLMKALQIA